MAKHRTRIGPIHDFRTARRARAAYGDGMFAFTQPVNTDRAYGDGMFAFTQPVNTDRAYADGGMFFTQPVGMGNVGPAPGIFQHAGYGAAPQPLRGKPSVKATAAAKTATEEEKKAARQAGREARQSSRAQTETRRSAVTASREVVARFEEAARKYGETLFWKNFWSRPSALAGTKFTTSSATLKAADEQKFSDAKAALNAAREELLRGVPAFAAGGTGGLPTDRAGRALLAYETALQNDGFYKVAFRNATDLNKRKPSKAVYDAIKRDALDLYAKDSISKDLAKNIVRAYILADMESSWDADNAEWGITTRPNIPRSTKAENVTYTDPRTGRRVTVSLSYSSANNYNATRYYYLPPAPPTDTHFSAWVNWDKANSKGEAVRAAVMSGAFKNQLKADRSVQEALKASLPSRFATARSEWEAARKEHVEKAVTEQRATLQQEQAGRDTESRAKQAENLIPAVRDAGALALSKRAGAEAAALVGDVALTTTTSNEATAAANAAQNGSARIIALANAAAGFAAASGGTGAAANDRAKAAREEAEQLAADALTSAEAAFGQIAAAQAKADAMKAEADAEAQRRAASDAQVAANDAQARLARGEITQAEYDAIVARAQTIQNEADRLGQVADQKKAEADSVLAAVTPEGAMTVSEEAPVASKEGFLSKYKTEIAIAAAVGGVGIALWLRNRNKGK